MDHTSVESSVVLEPWHEALYRVWFRWEVVRGGQKFKRQKTLLRTSGPPSTVSAAPVDWGISPTGLAVEDTRSLRDAIVGDGDASNDDDLVELGEHEVLHVLFGEPPHDYFLPERKYEVAVKEGCMSREGERLNYTATGRFMTAPRDYIHRKNGAKGKRAIVLSGGGAKGDFQVGVLKYLYEVEKFFPDVLVGVSVGALNAAKLAEGRTEREHLAAVCELEVIWKALTKDSDIYVPTPGYAAIQDLMSGSGTIPTMTGVISTNPISLAVGSIPLIGGFLLGSEILDEVRQRVRDLRKKVRAFESEASLFSLAPLRAILEKNLDLAKIKRDDLSLSLGAVNLGTGELKYFGESHPKLVDCILASAGMPVVFPPVFLDGSLWTDGGVRDVAAVRQAIRKGATDIVVIPTYRAGKWPQEPLMSSEVRMKRMESIFERAIGDITFDEMLDNDISSHVREQAMYERVYGEACRIRIVDPEYIVHGSTTFCREGVRRSITYGYERAREILGGGTKAVVPQPVERTRTSYLAVVRPTFDNDRSMVDELAYKDTDLRKCFVRGKGAEHFNVPIGIVNLTIEIVDAQTKTRIHHYPTAPLGDASSVSVPVTKEVYAFPLHRRGKYIAKISVSAFEVSTTPHSDHPQFDPVRHWTPVLATAEKEFELVPGDDGIMEVWVKTSLPWRPYTARENQSPP